MMSFFSCLTLFYSLEILHIIDLIFFAWNLGIIFRILQDGFDGVEITQIFNLDPYDSYEFCKYVCFIWV